MHRSVIDCVPVCELDDLTGVHDGYAVRDVPYDGKVVGDEQVGEALVVLEVLEKVYDLSSDRDVESRDGLVGDDEIRFEGKRSGNSDALALAATECMGVSIGAVGREPASFEERHHSVASVVDAVDDAMHDPRLGHEFSDGHSRVEAGVRILEDELHVLAKMSQCFAGGLGDVAAPEADCPGGRFDTSEDGPTGGGLSRAGFADKAKCFPRFDVEAHVIDRMHDVAVLSPKS